jgi:cobalt-zinc-cadmium efflux system outer membrane protein
MFVSCQKFMKQRIYSAICRSLAWSLVFTGGGFPGFAAQAADSPAALPSSSAATNVLTLEGAIRLALDTNPELRASGGRIGAAAGRAYQAKLWSNPELELSAEDWPINSGHGFSDSKQTVGLSQAIPFPGKKKLDRQIGVSGVRFSEAELDLRRLELIRDVTTAFYQVLAAERLVAVTGELVAVAESSAATARKRVAAGAAADQEQLRAEISLEQAKTERSGFQGELVTARQTLAMLFGRPDLTGVPVSGALAETVSPGLLEQGPDRWLADHPNVVAARTSREQARLELRRARLEPYPDVKIGVAGGRIGETDESIIQLGFSVPLPIIDRGKGKQQEARAKVTVADAELAGVEQRLLRDWGTASQRLRTAAEQVASYRERILPKANEALRLVQTGFEQGKFGFIDLLDTQRTTAEVRLAYQQKLLELNVARAEIEALLAWRPVGPKPTPATPSQTKPSPDNL